MRGRAELAASLVAARGFDVQVFVTERPGHARELAAAVLEQGVRRILGWGGDGTVNEIGSAIAFRDATLGIIPSGSGNGLARELAIPFDPARAIEVALGGREYYIDAGELDGHLFFNVAGLGLDARVAHRFAAGRLVRRGFARYAVITARELFTYKPSEHTIVADGASMRAQTLLIAIANSRQYGNGAVIAPDARLDDGKLDVVVVAARSAIAALAQVPRVFMGQMSRIPGVATCTAVDIEITSAGPVVYHVDGEPYVGGASIAARAHPGALRVAVPVGAR